MKPILIMRGYNYFESKFASHYNKNVVTYNKLIITLLGDKTN